MAKAKESLEPKRPEQQSEQTGERRQSPARHEPYHPSSIWSGSGGPLGLINRFADEMERMFENLGFGRGWGEIGQDAWSPQIEVFKRGGQFIVRADLPGLKKDDVKVDVTDDAITIQGERKQEHQEEREGWHRSERSYGSFFRSIPLPEGINVDEAKASFRDGVLEIAMPAPQVEERRRSIEIK
ncbi:MAG: Hsp20/alpha crystallin family protein [Blastocatellia bacterium]